MERLTIRLQNGVIKRTEVNGDNRGENIMSRLAAYEDLNLSPAEIAEKLKELAELRKATRWIPVSERLPEYSPSGTVKSYWVAYDTSKGKQMQIAVYSDYMYSTSIGIPPCVTWRDYESHKIKNVTHWMPLPEPPKENEQ